MSLGIGTAAIAPLVCVGILFGWVPTAFAQQPSAALQAKSTDAAPIVAEAAHGPVRIIVQYKLGIAAAGNSLSSNNIPARMQANAIAQDAILAKHFGGQAETAARAVRRMRIVPVFAINASAAEVESLASDPAVLTIQLDRLGKPQLIQSLPLIGSDTAGRRYLANGAGWAVAVLDSGVEATHAFLAGKVIAEACFSTTTGVSGSNGSVSICPGGVAFSAAAGSASNCNISWNGCQHGTHVAGIAIGSNSQYQLGQPANGVAKSAKVVAIQIYSQFMGSDCANQGQLSPCIAFWFSDLQAALEYVYTIRNDLPQATQLAAVNLSGGEGDFASDCDAENPSLKVAIDALRSVEIPVIISAGNDGNRAAISAPACISSAIAVASSTKTDAISSFSQVSPQVALFGPGGEIALAPAPILSSVPANYGCANFSGPSPIAGGSYCYLAGSSMAAAHVVGAWAAIKSGVPNATIHQILDVLTTTGTPINVALPSGTFTRPRIRVDLAIAATGATPVPAILAAVLPNARTTTVGNPITAFATIINTGANDAIGCTIALPSGLPANFLYQTTDLSTNRPTGHSNTPTNIAPGQAQSFFFAITPSQSFQADIALVFSCGNAAPAAMVQGLNTLLLTVSDTPVPDMLSVGDTPSHDGNVIISGSAGTGVMAVAAINIGAPGAVTFAPSDGTFGQASHNLPLELTICQTEPTNGQCINPARPAASLTVNIAENQTVTFSIFARALGSSIPYDPANNRIFVISTVDAVAVGEVSAAVKMK